MIEQVLLFISAIFLLAGLVLGVWANWKHRSEFGRTIRWHQVRHWFMPWKVTDVLTPRGVRLNSTSIASIMIGIALFMLAVWGLPLLVS